MKFNITLFLVAFAMVSLELQAVRPGERRYRTKVLANVEKIKPMAPNNKAEWKKIHDAFTQEEQALHDRVTAARSKVQQTK